MVILVRVQKDRETVLKNFHLKGSFQYSIL